MSIRHARDQRGLFGDIAVAAKPAAKPKAGSRPLYKFEMADGAPNALAGLFSEWRPRKGSSPPAVLLFYRDYRSE
jgi:hypothetical protein